MAINCARSFFPQIINFRNVTLWCKNTQSAKVMCLFYSLHTDWRSWPPSQSNSTASYPLIIPVHTGKQLFFLLTQWHLDQFPCSKPFLEDAGNLHAPFIPQQQFQPHHPLPSGTTLHSKGLNSLIFIVLISISSFAVQGTSLCHLFKDIKLFTFSAPFLIEPSCNKLLT